jgi:POT family proton-dependent oligopeptide transporter
MHHPKGFYVLAFVEFWERLSFYLMKALCALYMVERLGFSTAQAAEWMGWYVGAVYALPMPFGLLADRKLGPLRAAMLGAAVMMAGHLAMGWETKWGLLAAMALISAGSGFFKPSMQTLVRGLYRDGDPRIDSAYSQFYVAINLGALAAPVLGSWLRNRWGWAVAFESAAVGLGLGVGALVVLRQFVVNERSALSRATGVPLAPDAAIDYQPADPPDVARRVAAVVAVTVLVSLFWAVFNIDGGVLTLWTRDCVAGAKKKAELYAAVNPACILLLTPMVVWLFRWHSTLTKMVLGMLATCLGCALLGFGAQGRAVSWLWPVAFYLPVTIGELLISPILTALTAKIAPPRLTAFLLGVSLLSSSIGGVVSGQFSRLWGSMSHSTFFLLLGLLPATGAVALLVAWRPLRVLLGEVPQVRAEPTAPRLWVVSRQESAA